MRRNENDLGNVKKQRSKELALGGGTPTFRSLVDQEKAAKQLGKVSRKVEVRAVSCKSGKKKKVSKRERVTNCVKC